MSFHTVDSAGFVTHRCPSCDGVSHPATGSVLGPGYVLCWTCALAFARWVDRWTNARGKRGRGHVAAVSFYEAAAR